MKCPHCGQKHPDNFKFCPNTGKTIETQFKSCSNRNCLDFGKYILPIDSKFCPTCGFELFESHRREAKNRVTNDIVNPKVEYFDMGGSVLWGSCNLGAESPELMGDYYCWGETKKKIECSEDNYLYKTVKSTFFGFSKEYIYHDIGANIAGTRYDVVTHILGKEYMLPSRKHFKELEKKCSWELGELKGVKGWWVKNPRNMNKIFFPATGFKIGSDIRDFGTCGYYPTAEISSNGLGWNCILHFDFSEETKSTLGKNGFLGIGDACGLWFHGYNIRPIKKKNKY